MSVALQLATATPLGAACEVVTICPAVQGVGSALGQAAGSAAGAASNDAALAVFHALGSAISGAASYAIEQVVAMVFHPVTQLDVHADWFKGRWDAMLTVAALVVSPLLGAATIGALIRQDTGRLVRAWLVWLPASAFLTVCAVPLVSAAMTASDDMTRMITEASGINLRQALLTLTPAAVATPSGLFAALVAVLVLLGGIALWLELLVRAAAIYVTVFFLPLILAGLLWPATAHMVKRAIEVLVALILSKFVIVAVLTLGVAALGAQKGSTGDVLAGVAILLLAGFAPMALLRLVPLLEAAAIGHLEGRARQPIRAATDTAMRMQGQVPFAARMFGLGTSGVAGGGGGDGGHRPGGGGGGGDGGGGSPSQGGAGRVVTGLLPGEEGDASGDDGDSGRGGGGGGGDGGESGGVAGLTVEPAPSSAVGAGGSGGGDQRAAAEVAFLDGSPGDEGPLGEVEPPPVPPGQSSASWPTDDVPGGAVVGADASGSGRAAAAVGDGGALAAEGAGGSGGSGGGVGGRAGSSGGGRGDGRGGSSEGGVRAAMAPQQREWAQ